MCRPGKSGVVVFLSLTAIDADDLLRVELLRGGGHELFFMIDEFDYQTAISDQDADSSHGTIDSVPFSDGDDYNMLDDFPAGPGYPYWWNEIQMMMMEDEIELRNQRTYTSYELCIVPIIQAQCNTIRFMAAIITKSRINYAGPVLK